MKEDVSIRSSQADSVPLKLSEDKVSSKEPWQDDLLGRQEIAERLSSLIRNQQVPLTISISGHWGTGKTFLLERWHRDLEIDGFRAIYYNAWEDDFCDDPLLSIIGQLSEQFKEGRFSKLAGQAVQIGVQLVKQNLFAVPEKLTGLDFRVDQSKLEGRDFLEEYLNQRETKDRLKERLKDLAAEVAKETGRPIVFIVDELDRCRPTFAIELLERVKHIFDVSNIVFVFGINRYELCESLNSVYGKIDADIYLRRFFDLEFSLPSADSDQFCRVLIRKYHLEDFFQKVSVRENHVTYTDDYSSLIQALPDFCTRLDLSLRDTDSCVRLMAFAARSLPEMGVLFPFLLALLIPLKLKDRSLLRQFLLGERRASEVVDFVYKNESLQTDRDRARDRLETMEAFLYMLEGPILGLTEEGSAIAQLKLLSQGKTLSYEELLSKRTREEGESRARRLVGRMESEHVIWTTAVHSLTTLHGNGKRTIDYLIDLLDL